MTTTDARSQDTVAEVVLGVDTHLVFHVAVALDELGRRLGELTVPTHRQGIPIACLLGREVRSCEERRA